MSECRKKLLLTYYNTKYEEFRCILVHIMRSSTPHIHNALIDDIRDMVHLLAHVHIVYSYYNSMKPIIHQRLRFKT